MLVCVFSISKTCLWAFGQYLRFRTFCLGLKSGRTEGGVWLVPSLPVHEWCGFLRSVSVHCGSAELCPSPAVQSISGSVPGMEGPVIEHKGWVDRFEPFGSSVNKPNSTWRKKCSFWKKYFEDQGLQIHYFRELSSTASHKHLHILLPTFNSKS